MSHARGCLCDCRSRSHSSDTDLDCHKAALWVFVPLLLPSQLCAAHPDGLCLLGATCSALEVDHDCSLAIQDVFSHPSEVVTTWSACVCPVVLEQISFQSWSWVDLAQRSFVQEGVQLGTRLAVKSSGWISQNSSERRKISLFLERENGLNLISHLYFHDKNQQFQAIGL